MKRAFTVLKFAWYHLYLKDGFLFDFLATFTSIKGFVIYQDSKKFDIFMQLSICRSSAVLAFMSAFMSFMFCVCTIVMRISAIVHS